jgi:hypothetical protein
MLLDFKPPSCAFWICAAIRCANFTEMSRQRPDSGNLDSCDDVLDFFVADSARARADDEAREPFRMPRGVVERDEAASRNAEQVESRE